MFLVVAAIVVCISFNIYLYRMLEMGRGVRFLGIGSMKVRAVGKITSYSSWKLERAAMTKMSAVTKQAVGDAVKHHAGAGASMMVEEVTVCFVSIVSESAWVLGGTHWSKRGCVAVTLGKSIAGASRLVLLPELF